MKTLLLCSLLLGGALATTAQKSYVRLVKIVVDEAKLEPFKVALKLGTEAAVAKEPGVLSYRIFTEKEHPNIFTLIETYKNEEAYNSHIRTEHFKRYKATVADMVLSLEIKDVDSLATVAKR